MDQHLDHHLAGIKCDGLRVTRRPMLIESIDWSGRSSSGRVSWRNDNHLSGPYSSEAIRNLKSIVALHW